MKKCKNNRKQYIICYDIENSQIYDIFYYFYNRDEYVKCPKFQHYFNDYIGNNEIYLTNEYLERSKKLIDWYNKYNGLDKSHYQIVANTHKYLGNLYIYDCANCKIDSIFTFEPYTDNIEFNKIIEYIGDIGSNGANSVISAKYSIPYVSSPVSFTLFFPVTEYTQMGVIENSSAQFLLSALSRLYLQLTLQLLYDHLVLHKYLYLYVYKTPIYYLIWKL